MSGADVASLISATKGNEGFLEGNGIIILILFFLIFGFNGAWGNGGNGLTQAELQAGLYNQTVDRNLGDIRTQLCSNNTDMLTNVLQNRYDNVLQTNTISNAISSCCCENKMLGMENTAAITNAIHGEGEATRALITQNRMEDLTRELNLASIASANAVQTTNILNSLGVYIPKSCMNNYYPYYSGTTIQ